MTCGSTDDRLKFGTGGDMQLFHDGTASHIVSSGSDLRIDVPNFIVRSASGAESIIRASQNAAVELYYNNTKKFETTSTGIEVSGTSSTFAGTLTVQGAGAASYGSLSLVSSDSFIRLNTTGGTADKRKWDIRTISASGYEGLEFRTVNDANDVFSTKLSIAHGGNATFTGSVTIPNYIIHASDPNTFFGFDNNDQVAIKTSGNYNFFGDSTATTLYAAGGAKLKTTHVSVGTATTAGGTLIDGWKTTTQANAINDTTIATTAYVNNKIALIPAGLVFQGTWNASTNTPTLTSGSGTTGNFYIVSVAGSTNLDGITDWKVGDWAVFIEQGASDQWEKIDNSSVLDGFGTGQSVTKWDGSGTSNTLTNGPITFSGNDSTFAGDITLDDDLNFSTNGFADISNTGTGAMRFKPSSQTLALTLTGVNATFAGDVNMASAKIESDGSAAAGAYLELHHNNNNSTDVCATINLTNNAGGYASIIGGTTGANNTGYIEFKTDNAGTQGTVLTLNGDNSATFAGKIIAGQGVQFTGGTIAAATTVLHTNNVVYARGGSGGMFLQNSDGSDGMFIANDHVRIETGSSERMRIIANGNVGIGTTSPSEKLEVVGNIKITAALLSNQENTDVDTGTETVANVAIATYTAAFFDFVIKKTTNVRSGTVYACHDGTNVEFTETSTQDLGDTSDVTLSVDISGGNMRLRATTTSDNWSIKSLIRAI